MKRRRRWADVEAQVLVDVLVVLAGFAYLLWGRST
jgi:hypothetical protein